MGSVNIMMVTQNIYFSVFTWSIHHERTLETHEVTTLDFKASLHNCIHYIIEHKLKFSYITELRSRK